jgi:filamentous hemagglutinin family protein
MIARWSLLLTRLSLVLGSPAALAQIVTDGTVGPATRLSGPEMTIGAELGSTRGGNLFHSFQRFDIPTGQRATFTGPDQIQNVIGRVTGGQTSHIDGTLRSTVGQADVYLINPSGVVMGPNAKVDVPAAVHVSTADEVRFSDGSRYSATDPAASRLTLAAPESFGFLSPQPASLRIEGSQLELKPGKTATLTAGDVSIAGTAERRATLKAPGGEIRLEAVGDRGGQVSVTMPTEQPGSGRLIIDQANIETSGDGGGRLSVRAGEAHLTKTLVFADNYGATDDGNAGSITITAGALRLKDADILTETKWRNGRAGDIILMVKDRLEVLDESMIASNSLGSGDAGDVTVVAGNLELVDGSIFSVADSSGQAGDIKLSIEQHLEMHDGSLIASSSNASGNVGKVAIHAAAMSLDGGGVVSFSNRGSSGQASDIVLTVEAQLDILNGAKIASNSFGSGDSGSIYLTAGSVRLDNGPSADSGNSSVTSAAQPGSTGRSGDVNFVVGGLLEVINGAQISSHTSNSNNAGNVTISAGALHLDNGDSPDQFTHIISDTISDATGSAGTVSIQVIDLLEILNGAKISSSTFSSGDAGAVIVTAGTARFDGGGISQFTGISSQANPDSDGRGGDVTLIIGGRLEILNGAQVSTATFAEGDAGAINVSANAAVLDGSGSVVGTGIFGNASSISSGQAGSVTLTIADWLEIYRGAVISSESDGSNDAGMITVKAGALRMDGSVEDDRATGVFSDVINNSNGNGGTVSLDVSERLEILNGAQVSSSVFFGGGNSGSITIKAGTAQLDNAGIWTATFLGESAGNILLDLDGSLKMANAATINSSTYSDGNAGSIIIKASDARLNQASIFSQQELLVSWGDAGDVTLELGGRLDMVNGSEISSSTSGYGNSGTVLIRARDAQLDQSIIRSEGLAQDIESGAVSWGDAGDVIFDIGRRLELLNGGRISASTSGAGSAGNLRVRTDDLRIAGADSGIFSAGFSNLAVPVGDIDIKARRVVIEDGGAVSIQSDQTYWFNEDEMETLPNGLVQINADTLVLNSGLLTAESSGSVSASAIQIHADNLLLTNASRITTESQAADAGLIHIDGGSLRVHDSQITTWAQGQTRGNGGDIVLTPKHLILDGGFIQANTNAANASGGNILLNTRALIVSQGRVEIGGQMPQAFESGSSRNIIQAAAEGGEQGTISVTFPDLDITAALTPLASPFVDPDELFTNLCRTLYESETSSLVERGHGGLPPAPAAPTAISFTPERLDRLQTASPGALE